MYVYRNRRYEEEIGTLKCHREGEQKMVKTDKQKNTDTGKTGSREMDDHHSES
jgi:hypothetical protein